MRQKPLGHSSLLTLATLCFFLSQATYVSAQSNSSAQRELLDETCVSCHNFEDYAGGLDLQQILNDDFSDHAETWETAIRKLRAGMMPPPGQSRPEWDNYVALTEWMENEIDQNAEILPVSKPMHRLNRTEYANVIEDMLNIRIDPRAFLPSDSSARGFDNIAGSLSISSTLLESYSTAAARIARMAVGFWNSPSEKLYTAPTDTSQYDQIEGLPFGTRGGFSVEHNFQSDGEYKFEMQNFGVGSYIPGGKLELSIDGERVQLFDYADLGLAEGMGGENDGSLIATIPVKAGLHQVGATFIARHFRPPLNMIKQYDRKSIENDTIDQVQYYPAVGMLKIQGPFNAIRPETSPSREKIFTCRPNTLSDDGPACAREILTTLAQQAYRRPVTEAEVEVLMDFYENGSQTGVFEDGIEFALYRLLADPKFLIRTEQVPEDVAVGEAYRISDLELASRLSFLLWSTPPDEELVQVASDGRLSDPDVLDAQVRRMLEHPKSQALVENFAQQWLYLRNLPSTFPDGIYFPNWDAELRESFQRETELIFEAIMREDRSIVDVLDADYTFVNERLAKHYDIPNVYGSHFRRVELVGPELEHRRGMLGKGSFLTVSFTQNFRTSPVKRGVWIMENLLGSPPPQPPPNVPALEDTLGSEDSPIRILRDQLTLHRENEPCATCHGMMDPIGFALENFDADGSWRELEGHPRIGDGKAYPLNTEVTLWDGTKASNPSDLRNNLLRYTPQFVRFVTEKLMTYGIGRGVEYYDMPLIRSIVEDAADDDYRFSSLVLGIVNSAPFQMRIKEEESI